MIEEYKSSSWSDFRQRYQNTFGWYQTDSGKRIIVRVEQVTESKVIFVDKDDHDYSAYPDKGNTFQFIPVEKGVHNTKDGVILCERKTARQFQRGLCIANTRLVNISRGRNLSIDFELVETIFGPSNVDYITKFRNNPKTDVALDNSFAIVNNHLVLYDHELGSFDGKSIKLNNKIFEQEINDLITKLELPISVEIK